VLLDLLDQFGLTLMIAQY